MTTSNLVDIDVKCAECGAEYNITLEVSPKSVAFKTGECRHYPDGLQEELKAVREGIGRMIFATNEDMERRKNKLYGQMKELEERMRE